MEKDYFNPYFEYFSAVSKILNGIPTPELSRLKQECDESLLELITKIKDPTEIKILNGHKFKADNINTFAEVENRILLGEDPTIAYADFDFDICVHRPKLRKVLETIVGSYKN